LLSYKTQNLIPYSFGEQPKGGFIKLNTNEFPYPPSQAVGKVLAGFNSDLLRLYPDPNCSELVETIAKLEGVKKENVFVGNGSDEVLAFSFYALFDKTVAYPNIGYSFYPVYADFFGLKKVPLKMQDDLSFDILNHIDSLKNACGLVLANPNAPTSLSVEPNDLEKFVRGFKGNIIVDEAYIDFALKAKSVSKLAVELDNLLVVKTLSKSYALAGLRCGYAVGNSEFIQGLHKVKNSFNSYTLDAIAQSVAIASLQDREYFNSTIKKTITTREKIKNALKTKGHFVLNSDANFLFIKHKYLDGEKVYSNLKAKNILVRHFNSNPLISPFVRVTIGTDSDMEQFMTAFNALR